MKEAKILGTKVNILTRREVEASLTAYLKSRTAHMIVTANAEMYYQAYQEKEFQDILNKSDLTIPDSIGIIWALRKYGITGAELYPGIEICEWLLRQNSSIYILGSSPKVLDRINFPNIVGKHHGYFNQNEETKIIAEINLKRPQILLVALGAGRQERWLAKHKEQLPVAIVMGVGGTIDVLSGAKKRAPNLFRSLKLEWFYRLIREPRRIFRQYKLLLFYRAVLKDVRHRHNRDR